MSTDTLTQTEKKQDADYQAVTQDQSCHATGDDAEHKHGRGLSHMAMMALCCAAPIILLSLLPLFARISPAFGSFLSKAAIFICPIGMILMLPMMLRGHKHKH